MLKKRDADWVTPGSARLPKCSDGLPGGKREVALRRLRGAPVDGVSREVSVPIYKLEQSRDRALAGIDAGLKERENDSVERPLDEAKRRIGELVMGVEILQKATRVKRP